VDQPRAQHPPPQHPPPPPPDGPEALPVTATEESSFTVSSWPQGQVAGSLASAIGRLSSNVESHVRQR